MTDKPSATPSVSAGEGKSALEREADHVDKLMNSGSTKPQSAEDLEKGEKRLRVEQDNRVAQVKAEAKEAGQGEEKPNGGLNPDG